MQTTWVFVVVSIAAASARAQPLPEPNEDDCPWCVDFCVVFESVNQDVVLDGIDNGLHPTVIGKLCWDGGYVDPAPASDEVKPGDGLISLDVYYSLPLIGDTSGDTSGLNHVDETDEVSYPLYPIAQFEYGSIVGLEFVWDEGLFRHIINGNDFTAVFDGFTQYEGYVVFKEPYQVCEVIPTPAAFGAGLGPLGLLAVRRRRAA